MKARWSKLDGHFNDDIVDGHQVQSEHGIARPASPMRLDQPHRTGASLDSWRLVIPQYELHLSCSPKFSLERTYMLRPQYVNLAIPFYYAI